MDDDDDKKEEEHKLTQTAVGLLFLTRLFVGAKLTLTIKRKEYHRYRWRGGNKTRDGLPKLKRFNPVLIMKGTTIYGSLQ